MVTQEPATPGLNDSNRLDTLPDSKVYGANMGPTWGRQDPGGPHVEPINFAIWAVSMQIQIPSLIII